MISTGTLSRRVLLVVEIVISTSIIVAVAVSHVHIYTDTHFVMKMWVWKDPAEANNRKEASSSFVKVGLGGKDDRRKIITSEKMNEPSHLSLCRIFLSNNVAVEYQDKSKDVTIVREDRSVCLDSSQTYSSLLRVFASALVANLAQSQNSGSGHILYEHQCVQPKLEIHENSTPDKIQEVIPPLIAFPDGSINKHMIQIVKESCTQCVSEYDEFLYNMKMQVDPYGRHDEATRSLQEKRKSLSFPSCLLYADGEHRQDITPAAFKREWIESLLPALRHNIRLSKIEWDDFLRTLRTPNLRGSSPSKKISR